MHRVTVGADFEFEVYDTIAEKVIGARNFIFKKSGIVGLDGCSEIGEIRPQYSADVNEFFENIIKAAAKLKKKFSSNFFKITFDSIEYPTGFHVHVGFYNKEISISRVGKLLSDTFYGTLYKYNSPKRKSSDYSRSSNYRYKDYGIEYREAPSILMNNTEYLRIYIKSVKKTVENIIDGNNIQFPKREDGVLNVENEEEFFKKAFDLNDYEIKVFKQFVNGNYEDLKGKKSPVLDLVFQNDSSVKYKGRWNTLKKYIILNFIYNEFSQKYNLNTIEFSKGAKNIIVKFLNDDKKWKLNFLKDFVEKPCENWEKDKEYWKYFIEEFDKIIPINTDQNLLEQYLMSFYETVN